MENKVLMIDRWWETTRDYIGVGEWESYEEDRKGTWDGVVDKSHNRETK